MGTAQLGYLEEEPDRAPRGPGAAPLALALAVVGLLVAGSAGVAIHKPGQGGGTRLGVGQPAPIALASAAAALRSHTVRMHMTISVVVTTHGRVVNTDVNGDGQTDYAARATQMAMTISVAGTGGLPQLLSEEFRIVGGYVYLRVPRGAGLGLPPGKLWVRQPLPPQLANAGASDPSQSIDQLRSLAKELQVVGTETVGGLETTHYRATVVLADTPAWAAIQARSPALVNNPVMQALAHRPFTVDAWIDTDGRLRRMGETIQFFLAGVVPGAGPGDGEVTRSTIDVIDYGAPVRVEAPPADQTSDHPIPGLFGNPLAPG